MPVLVNKQTGLAEEIPQDLAEQAMQSGSHTVALNDPQGNPVTADYEQAQHLLGSGYTQPSTEQLQDLLKVSKYSTAPEKIKTFLEGAGVGGSLGLSTKLETMLGAKPEDIQGRRDVNEGVHSAGQIAGLAGTSFIPGASEAALLSDIGKGSSAVIGLGAEGAGALSRIGGSAVRFGAENAVMSAGDELSKRFSQDPNQTSESALTHIGLAGLLGGALGAPMGALAPIWEKAQGSKIGQLIEDFKSQVRARAENPNPIESLTEELSHHYDTVNEAAHQVYGEKGIKSKEIASLLPEVNEKISSSSSELLQKSKNLVEKMQSSPDSYPAGLVSKLESSVNRIEERLNPSVSGLDSLSGLKPKTVESIDYFNGLNELKQDVQSFSKFNKYMPSTDPAYDFVQATKSLGHDIRTTLENTDVWGKAAERQQAINKSFSKYLPTLQDFEKKFTTKVEGIPQIDPGKINTYINQLGKPNAELKQEMLKNFIDASEKYKNEIHQSHLNMGIESPVKPSSLNISKATFNKLTPGARIANAMVDRGLSRLGGEALGAGVGGGIGHIVGAGGIGALIGEHALGPFFSSILPSLSKSLLEKETNAAGFKAASELGASYVRSENTIGKAIKAVLKSSANVLPQSLEASDREKNKIKDKVSEFRLDPTPLLEISQNVGHYLPDHGTAVSSTLVRAIQYLGSIKPSEDKLGVLDPPRKPSQPEVAAYDRAIELAQQPLGILKDISAGTLTVSDIKTVHTIYPGLYSSLSQKLMDEMISHTAKGEQIPYKTRMSLSLFFGQPLDSTMTSQSIMASQPKRQQPGQKQVSNRSESMKELGKLVSMYQTPDQARRADKLKQS